MLSAAMGFAALNGILRCHPRVRGEAKSAADLLQGFGDQEGQQEEGTPKQAAT